MADSTTAPLHVCIASRAPFVGGAEVAALRLAQGLMSRGHKVIAALGEDNQVRQRFTEAHINTVHMPLAYTGKTHYITYLSRRRSIRRFLRQNAFDILHINDLPTAQIFLDAARGLPLRTLIHHRFLYDGPTLDWFNKFTPDRHLFVSRGLMQPLCEASSTLTQIPCEVVYDGLSIPSNLQPPQEAEARRWNRHPTILFAGQMIAEKGPQDLIQAWSLLPPSLQQKAHLVLIGDDLQHEGAYHQKMVKLVNQRGICADLPGFQRDVSTWLAQADVAVVPSHVEPLGNATLEAMAAGLPVIGSRVGGIPEMIVDGVTGLLCNPADPDDLSKKLVQLLENPTLRQTMGHAGHTRCAEVFGLDTHITRMLEIYRELLHPAQRKVAA